MDGIVELTEVRYTGLSFGTFDGLATYVEKQMKKSLDAAILDAGVGMELFLKRVTDNIRSRNGNSWPQGSGAFGTVPDRLTLRSGKGSAQCHR